jgi:hypothetical protein
VEREQDGCFASYHGRSDVGDRGLAEMSRVHTCTYILADFQQLQQHVNVVTSVPFNNVLI